MPYYSPGTTLVSRGVLAVRLRYSVVNGLWLLAVLRAVAVFWQVYLYEVVAPPPVPPTRRNAE